MNAIFVAFLLLVPVVQSGTRAPASGDAQAGKALWEGAALSCKFCHGLNGEGAFGPDLAGRQLSVPHFRQAVRKPWGIMPAYTEQQLNDQEISNLVAYFNSLPAVAQPGPWRFEVPAGAPHGQQVALATVGCAQCHGPTLNGPRASAGAVGADFEWFKKMVYEHTTSMPQHWNLVEATPAARLRMGNYSRTRLPESLLQEVWRFANDLGLRVPIAGQLSAGAPGADGVTYTLTVENEGVAGKGLTAEDLTISLAIPAGSSVIKTTGNGYQGVRRDEQVKGEVAVWRLPRIAAKERHTYSITFSRAADNLRGTVRWTKPAVKMGSPNETNIAPPPQQSQ
jgi:mono/diheme cytochrome c family protein